MAMTRHTALRLLAAPRLDDVTAQGLGFDDLDLPERHELDRIPRAVVVGFEAAMESRSTGEVVNRVELLDPALHGFGYEGVAMGWTILDATSGGNRTRDLLNGPARPHLFLAYIGIGFAMRKLPRALWRSVLPAVDAPPYHPTLSWLAVDGYGFDLAYFGRARHVDQQRRPRTARWMGRSDYFQRAVDQGIGRALWFIHGAQVPAVAATVRRFATARRADLWSGIGVAAAVAGPRSDCAIDLRDAAGGYAPHIATGAVLGARARVSAGVVPAHSAETIKVLSGLNVDDAAELADATAVTADTASAPAYEAWRRAIRTEVDAS